MTGRFVAIDRRDLVRRRVPVALVLAVVGTGVFVPVSRLVRMDEPLGLVGCFVGAFASSLVAYDEKRLAWWDHVLPAFGIVVATFVMIGLGWGAAGTLSRRAFDLGDLWGGVGTALFFGAIFTSWWLVPAVATVLWALNGWGRLARETVATTRSTRSPSDGR